MKGERTRRLASSKASSAWTSRSTRSAQSTSASSPSGCPSVTLNGRGLPMTLVMGSRPTYLLGHTLPHGVPYYFPFVFALKSTLGFLVLLAFTLTALGFAVFAP